MAKKKATKNVGLRTTALIPCIPSIADMGSITSNTGMTVFENAKKNPAITPDALIVKCEKEAMPKTATLLLEYKAAL